MKSIVLIAGLALLLFSGCSQQPTDMKSVCCSECTGAFSKSPAALGPEAAQCGDFPTSEPLGKQCRIYFEKNDLTVAQCELNAGPDIP